MGENLSRMGRDEKWITKKVKEQGYKSIAEVFLGIYRKEEDFLSLYPYE